MAKYRNYLITDKAGPYVAGQRNTGVGTKLFMSEKEAEAGLRVGHLVDADADARKAEKAADKKVSGEKKPAKPAENPAD